MIVKLLTEHHLRFLSLKGGCRGSSESTLVKMSNCWKSHATAHIECSVAFYLSYYFFKKQPYIGFLYTNGNYEKKYKPSQ